MEKMFWICPSTRKASPKCFYALQPKSSKNGSHWNATALPTENRNTFCQNVRQAKISVASSPLTVWLRGKKWQTLWNPSYINNISKMHMARSER